MKKFWIGNLALSLLLIMAYLIIGRAGVGLLNTVQIARIILYVSIVQLFAETICAIVRIDSQTRMDIVFSVSALFFSVLIALFMWPIVYNATV